MQLRNTLTHLVPQVIVLIVLLRSVKMSWVNGKAIGLRWPGSPIWPLLTVYVCYTAGFEAIAFSLGAETSSWHLGWFEIGLRILGIVVFAPILEEWIFRGVLLEVLERRWSFLLSNLLQAVAFVLLHAPDLMAGAFPRLNGAQVVIDALFFGFLRHRTRSLYPGILAHALGNSLAVFERLL